MIGERAAEILVLTNSVAPDRVVLAAVRGRAGQGPARFRVLVPNPARAEVHLLHPERHDKAFDAEFALLGYLPVFEAAAGGRVLGSVSIRHDPFDAVQELLLAARVDEIMVSLGATRSRRDLAHRLLRFAVRVTVIGSAGLAD